MSLDNTWKGGWCSYVAAGSQLTTWMLNMSGRWGNLVDVTLVELAANPGIGRH